MSKVTFLSQPRICNGSSWSMLVFGAIAGMLGLVGILWPNSMLMQLGLMVVLPGARLPQDYTLVFILAASMASLNMGVYYIFAALQNWKAFYTWTVPFRGLTFTVFTTAVLLRYAPTGILAIALWELTGALITGAFLLYENRHNIV